MKRKIAVLVLVPLVFSCYVIEDYQLEYAGDRLVVYGMLTNDEGLTVNVSRSQPPTGTMAEEVGISGARVLLYRDGEVAAELTESGGGVYETDYSPDMQGGYHLEVHAEGFQAVVSEVERMPEAFPLKGFSYEKKDEVLRNSRPGFEMVIDLEEPRDPEGYLEFVVHGFHPRTGYVWLNLGVRNRVGETSNPYFEGESEMARLEFEESWPMRIDGQFQEIRFERFVVSMRKVSESYVRYWETAVVPFKIEYAFYEPRILYNNIKGGYGLFGTRNETQVEILNP